MNIFVTYGIGEGSTELSAFDAALWDAGIANYNLIYLSSIIPAGSKIKVKKLDWNYKDYGNKLEVVMSEAYATESGVSAYAGLGWAQDRSGKGVLVEHEGALEKSVKASIHESLKEMKQRRRTQQFQNNHLKIVGITCKDKPVCALVAAVYRSEGW